MVNNYASVSIAEIEAGDMVTRDKGKTWDEVADVVYESGTDQYHVLFADSNKNFAGSAALRVSRKIDTRGR